MERERVLSIRDLEISFDTVHGKAAAIRGMRFDLYRGETVAIVGDGLKKQDSIPQFLKEILW